MANSGHVGRGNASRRHKRRLLAPRFCAVLRRPSTGPSARCAMPPFDLRPGRVPAVLCRPSVPCRGRDPGTRPPREGTFWVLGALGHSQEAGGPRLIGSVVTALPAFGARRPFRQPGPMFYKLRAGRFFFTFGGLKKGGRTLICRERPAVLS